MKKIAKCLFIIIFAIALIVPQHEIGIQAASVKISKKKATMEVDSILTLKVTGTSSKVSWSSSDKTIATVTKKGKVTAKKEGTAKITAKVGNDKYDCNVTVVDNNKKGSNTYNIVFPQADKEFTVIYGSGRDIYSETKITKISYEIIGETLSFSFIAETIDSDSIYSWMDVYYAIQDSDGVIIKEYEYFEKKAPGTKKKITETINLARLGLDKGEKYSVVFIDKGYIY